MDSEGIILSEISQRRTNTAWFHVYVASKKIANEQTKLIDTENRLMAAREAGSCKEGKMGERD